MSNTKLPKRLAGKSRLEIYQAWQKDAEKRNVANFKRYSELQDKLTSIQAELVKASKASKDLILAKLDIKGRDKQIFELKEDLAELKAWKGVEKRGMVDHEGRLVPECPECQGPMLKCQEPLLDDSRIGELSCAWCGHEEIYHEDKRNKAVIAKELDKLQCIVKKVQAMPDWPTYTASGVNDRPSNEPYDLVGGVKELVALLHRTQKAMQVANDSNKALVKDLQQKLSRIESDLISGEEDHARTKQMALDFILRMESRHVRMEAE